MRHLLPLPRPRQGRLGSESRHIFDHQTMIGLVDGRDNTEPRSRLVKKMTVPYFTFQTKTRRTPGVV